MQLSSELMALHKALGIPEGYIDSTKMPCCLEPSNLVATESDFYGREQKLTPASFNAWRAMKAAATVDGVSIFLISAYRSYQYQHDLLKKKLDAGASIDEILSVNAAPGFSEHHTGRAIDIGTLGCDALVEEFENTDSFQWLILNAAKHGFSLSYPRNNPFGIIYEPWHWCYQCESESFDLAQ